MLLKQDPPHCHKWDEHYEVHKVIVGLVPECFADNANEEDKAYREILCFYKYVNFFHIVRSEKDTIRGLESLCNQKYNRLEDSIYSLQVEWVA